MSENNDNSNESSSLGSDSLLQSSRLTGGGGVGASHAVLRAGVLRPSVLGPSRLGSSFSTNNNNNNNNVHNVTSSTDAEGEADSNAGVSNGSGDARKNPFQDLKEEADTSNNAEGDSQKVDDDDEIDDRPDPLTILGKNGIERANLFAAAKSSMPLVEKSGFVFGQNVHERVVGENVKSDKSSTSGNEESASSTSGDLLFSSVIQNAATKPVDSADTANAEAKSLTDVAREYEESRAQKRKFDEVEKFTGEENELNIVDLNCKLFAFDNSNWEERGRGSLRLNDSKKEHECSRLVFRTAGNLRLLLNTKVWAGMVAQRPSQKSLRLTAMDNTGKIKIFLVMARPVEIHHLHNALVDRIEKRKQSHPEELCAVGGADTSDNNGDETVPIVETTDEEHAASLAEPEHDDSAEPSPKKTAVVVEQSANVPDSSDN